MDQLLEFTGRFHPLLVHLPIGFLLIAVVFIWIKEPGRAVKIALGLGALAAIASVITGLLLASSEGYGEEVTVHKWSGIVLAIVSTGMWFVPERYLKHGSIAMTIMILVTGHFGGTLTHGPLIPEPEADNLDLSQIDLNNAQFYNDAVQPILEARCYSCHGETKQKGRLRLDTQEAINKGGKDGKVIAPGNPEESELVKRIDLPLDDEDHMPPKERKQLTDQEKRLISLWIASGSDYNKKISESLSQHQIAELSTVRSEAIELPDVPAPDQKIIDKLTEQNVAITPIAKGSNCLQVNFISVPEEATALIAQLKPIARNVVSLKLNNTKVVDVAFGDFTNLMMLNVAGTDITDKSLDEIVKCRSLVSLNLSSTKISSAKKLQSLEKLKYLNIFNTSITDADMPGVVIEKGNYTVPTFETDTTFIKSN